MCQSCARAHVCILYLMNGYGKTKQARKQKKLYMRKLRLWF